MSIPLAKLTVDSSPVDLRPATLDDLPGLVRLLANDRLGSARETTIADGDLTPYEQAFHAIDADPAHLLIVATNGHDVLGTMQLTFLPGLSRRGALRAQIEAVRVHETYRGRGLGAAMFTWAIDEAKRRGCALVQLTTDKTRVDAIRFYDRLGFQATHNGLKLQL